MLLSYQDDTDEPENDTPLPDSRRLGYALAVYMRMREHSRGAGHGAHGSTGGKPRGHPGYRKHEHDGPRASPANNLQLPHGARGIGNAHPNRHSG